MVHHSSFQHFQLYLDINNNTIAENVKIWDKKIDFLPQTLIF